MSIRENIQKLWLRLTGGRTDTEISADEVVQNEIFPEERHGVDHSGNNDSKIRAQRPPKKGKPTAKKPPSKRTRPTNPDYKMIDPDDDTADTGKS